MSRIGLVFVLTGGVFLFGYGDNAVLADNIFEIDSCNNEFDSDMSSCDAAYGLCMAGCSDEPCRTACGLSRASCYSNATSDYGDCLNDVVFEMEMCPNAPEAAALCDAAFTGCEAAAMGIEDEQEANALVADCMYTHYQCLQKSGLWQCQ